MTDACRLRHMDNEELIREYRSSDNSALREFSCRLAQVIDESTAEIQTLNSEVRHLQMAECGQCDSNEAQIDRLIEKIEAALEAARQKAAA